MLQALIFFLLAIFILHSRESELYRYVLDGMSALAWDFQGVWATCLLHKGVGVPLRALPKDATSELAGLFSTTSLNVQRPPEKLWILFLKVFWYDPTRGMNPWSTDCEADAQTKPLRHRLGVGCIKRNYALPFEKVTFLCSENKLSISMQKRIF